MMAGMTTGSWIRPAPEDEAMEPGSKPLSKVGAWEQADRRQVTGDRAPAQRHKYQRAGQCERVLGNRWCADAWIGVMPA